MLMSNLKMKKNSQQQSKQVLKRIIRLKKKTCEKVCINNAKERKTDNNNSPSKLSSKNKKSSIKSNSTQVLFKQKNTSIVSPQTDINKEISKTQNKNQIKNWRLNANIENNDYKELECQKLKIENNWLKNKRRGSLINDQIINQYGYSNLSDVKINGKKSLSSLSKKGKRFLDKQQIQRLLHKYSQHLRIPRQKSSSNSRSKIFSSKSKISSSRNKKFRTLSTDDKSQKYIQIGRKQKVFHNQINEIKKMNRANNQNWFEKKKIKTEANLHSHEKKKDKKAKSFKQNKSSKTILPDYFCCLSINKVQSKIQMIKDKQCSNSKIQQHITKMNKIQQRQDQQKIKDSLSQTQKIMNKRKFEQKLILTKLKQQKHKQNKLQVNKQIFNKQTKKTSLTSRLNIQRSTISLLKKKGQNKLKDKNQKRSRKLSRRQIKIN